MSCEWNNKIFLPPPPCFCLRYDSSFQCGAEWETHRAKHNAFSHSPLEDIPQKSLVGRSVGMRGSSVRTVVRHFKGTAVSKMCKWAERLSLSHAVVSSNWFNLSDSSWRHTACPLPLKGVANHSPLPISTVTSHCPMEIKHVFRFYINHILMQKLSYPCMLQIEWKHLFKILIS